MAKGIESDDDGGAREELLGAIATEADKLRQICLETLTAVKGQPGGQKLTGEIDQYRQILRRVKESVLFFGKGEHYGPE